MSGEYQPYTMADVAKVEGTNGLTVASTFSGGGGSSIGYKLAGFNVEYAKACAADGLMALEDGSLDLCIFCLTLQFMAARERDEAVALAHKKLRAGGAAVIVQKDETDCKTFDDIAVRKYYELKERNGYSREQIETKKRALNGYMEIDTYRQSVGRLILAGFGDTYEFWRSLNFSAVLAIK